MAIYNGPSRGGNRGGKDQFNWDKVKEVSMQNPFATSDFFGVSIARFSNV
jgi:hypothetical protein